MNKRGLSDVVTTVLIILLVLAAVVIIWSFIRPVIFSSSERLSTMSLGLDLSVQKVEIVDGIMARVYLKLGASSEETINKFKITLSDDVQSKVYDVEGTISPLGSKPFDLNLTFQPKKVEVVPILSVNGKESMGRMVATFLISNLESAQKSLVAYFPFNGDVSSYSTVVSYTTQNIGGVTYGPGKNGGSSLYFDGSSNKYINVTGPILTSDFTVSAWVNATDNGNLAGTFGRVIASSYKWANPGTDQRGWVLGILDPASSYFGLDIYGPDGSLPNYVLHLKDTTNFNSPAYIGNWVHVVGVFKAGTGGYAKLFINGVNVTEVHTGIPASVGDPMLPITIGIRPDNTAQGRWKGNIDDLRIYNRALSNEEVNYLYKTT